MQPPIPSSGPRVVRQVHHRAPREWPALRSDPILLPYPTPHSQPPITSLLIGAAGLAGIIVSFFLFGRSANAGLGAGLLAVSGLTALASVATYVVQMRGAKRDNAELLANFSTKLDSLTISADGRKPGLAELAKQAEAGARRANDPPLLTADATDPDRRELVPLTLSNPGSLWQRQPQDPDFLAVRVGLGRDKPRFDVRLETSPGSLETPTRNAGFRRQHERAHAMVDRYAWLDDVPIVIPLRQHASVALVGGPSGASASALARALIGQVVLHHSPREARVVVLASARNAAQWSWAQPLAASDAAVPALITGDPATREHGIQRLHGELNRREQALGGQHHERERDAPLPHLVIVVDALLPDDVSQMANPAIDLAVRRGKELGATVVSLHSTLDQAPKQTTVAVDLLTSSLLYLWPDPPPPVHLSRVDGLPVESCGRVVHAFTRFAPEEVIEERLPTEVSLLDLFIPRIERPERYDIQRLWQATRAAAAAGPGGAPADPSVAIPIGRGASGQTVMLDFVKDGPHGLLIGQTGSGKSELLRSIITALAMKYPYDQARFVLVDYKGGVELETFDQVPHTLVVLTNLDQAGQTTRFLAMLESELRDRQELSRRREYMPHLFVVIDEFAEMVAPRGANDNADAVMESVLRILRLGRSLKVHLLFAAQRPDSLVIGKLRGYVQYRICLRTNTEEDSREVLGRPDAAHLPVQFPGRGYMLRGDYELQLFQAARVANTVTPSVTDGGAHVSEEPRTVDQIVAERMKPLAAAGGLIRWPKALPSPDQNHPTPLILLIGGGYTPVEDAWNAMPRDPLPKMMAPLGLYDRPSTRTQDWFLADLFGHAGPLEGGPLIVMGDLNAGKTTTLKTLLLYFATYASPQQLRFYVLDPTGAFADFKVLPHAQDFLNPDAVNIVDGSNAESFQELKGRFLAALEEPPERGRPPLLLVVDDYEVLGEKHEKQLHDLAELVAQSRDRDAYLAIAAARQTYNGLPSTLISVMATKVALYMGNRDNLSALIGPRIPFIPLASRPGHGFVQTRSTLDEVQIAAPVFGLTESARIATLRDLLAARAAALR